VATRKGERVTEAQEMMDTAHELGWESSTRFEGRRVLFARGGETIDVLIDGAPPRIRNARIDFGTGGFRHVDQIDVGAVGMPKLVAAWLAGRVDRQ